MMSRVRLFCLAVFVADIGSTSGIIRTFPDDFEFGVSTAAYQIEGAWNEDGKGPSIWDDAVHSVPSPVIDGSTGDVAGDSYHNYEHDVEIMKELGVEFYRFSISWSRILPNGFSNKINRKGLDYYHNLINAMLRNNIKPFVTMYHWDLPSDFQMLGGWANSEIVDYFVDYAKVLLDNFGDKVHRWVTINEPRQICYDGYGTTRAAPFLNYSGIAEYLCVKNLLLAHAKVYHMYNQRYKKANNGTMGIAVSIDWYEPATDNPDDIQAAIDARQFFWGIFNHPIFSKAGDFPEEVKRNVAIKSAEQGFTRSRLPVLFPHEVDLIRGSADFLGINAYTTKLIYKDTSVKVINPIPSYYDDMGAVMVDDPSWPRADRSPWLREVPWGFYKTLLEVKRLYNSPQVHITENGWSNAGGLADNDRVRYLRNYMASLLDAMKEGCDVKSYAVWSLIDNFEWAFGYTQRFGLYQVDFDRKDRMRTPRKSAFVYKEVIRTRTLDPDYEPESLANFVVQDSRKNHTYF